MFDRMFESRQNQENRIKYMKRLGWNEFDGDGDKNEAVIFVYDVDMGYGVFRNGTACYLLYHCMQLDEAVEWGVEEARRQINAHEIEQVNRKIPE